MTMEPALVRDVVIVVPGIMGSELIDRKGRPVWSVSPGSLVDSIRALARNELTLPAGIGDGPAPDGIRPGKVLDSLHVVPGLWTPVTGYDGLMDFLRSARFHFVEPDPGDRDGAANLLTFPYDWRLSNRHNGRLLARFAREALAAWRRQVGMGEAKLVLVCHSMGGLVARWFAAHEDGAESIRALVTVGTPHRGSVKALATLVNGLEPGLGPLRFSLSRFARSLPSLHELLPQYRCLVDGDARSSLRETTVPGLDAAMLHDACAFHDALLTGSPDAYRLHKVVGIRQPTPTTARVDGASIVTMTDIDGHENWGDGTVPRLSAEPEAGRGTEVHEVAGQHGELQSLRSLLDLVDGIVTREEIVWASAADEGFGLSMADLCRTDETPVVEVDGMDGRLLFASLQDERGQAVGGRMTVPPDGRLAFDPLPEGGYRVVVRSAAPGLATTVAKPFVVMDATRSDAAP